MDPARESPSTPDATRHPGPDAPGDRLDGWKAIAGYLGRDVRTVQRWELTDKLPVHRLEHRQRATAYAFTGELDRWLAARAAGQPDEDAPAPLPESAAVAHPSRRRWAVAALAVGTLAVVIVGAVTLLRPGRAGQQRDTKDGAAFAFFAEGQALYASRQYRDAAIALERAVSRDPSFGAAWAVLAKTYGRLSQPMWAGGRTASDRAVEAATRAESLAPGLADTHVALSLSARSLGDVSRWRAEAQRALDLDARSAEALGMLADSYSAYVYSCNCDQNPQLAEDYYRRAVELQPNLTTTVSNRAHNLRRMGRYAECIELMDRAIRSFRDETPLLAERGACRLLAGDLDGARADILPLRNSPKLAPAGSLVYLGLLDLKTGQTEQGITDLEAVFQLDQTARSELIVAEVYGSAGDVDRALVHLKRAFDLDAACAKLVAHSVAFEPLHHAPTVTHLLAQYGVR